MEVNRFMPPLRSALQRFEAEIQHIKERIAQGGPKPSLLLHSCCGPCSSAIIEQLAQVFRITLYYYNPNIYPRAEYERRRDELQEFIQRFPAALGVELVVPEYHSAEFYQAIDVEHEPQLKFQPEKQERCRRCYLLRMEKAYQYASDLNFDYITTTLSISPLKDSQLLNHLGEAIGKEVGVPYLPSDFKKRGGYLRSIELSKEYGLYRQNYCGCVFSKREAEQREKQAASSLEKL